MKEFWERHWVPSAVVLGVSSAALLWFAASPDSVLRTGDGSALYTATITAAAALAALGIVPISIVLGLNSPRVRRLGRLKGQELRRSVALAVGWHLVTIVISTLLLGLDSATSPLRAARIAAVVALMLGVEATLRAVVEFLAMLRLDNETGDAIGKTAELPADFAKTMTTGTAALADKDDTGDL